MRSLATVGPEQHTVDRAPGTAVGTSEASRDPAWGRENPGKADTRVVWQSPKGSGGRGTAPASCVVIVHPSPAPHNTLSLGPNQGLGPASGQR